MKTDLKTDNFQLCKCNTVNNNSKPTIFNKLH